MAAKRGATVAAAREAALADAKKPKPRTGEARKLIKRVGRPSALTEGLIYGIADMVLAGNYREVAAAAHGVSRQTLHNWLARGEEHDGGERGELDETGRLYVEFLYALRVAEAHSEVQLLAEAREPRSHWQAPMTVLERRFPPRWKRRDELEHSGEVGTRVSLSPEQAAAELDAFEMPAAKHVAAGPDSVPPPEDA